MDLKGKKILVLGGNALSCDIVNAAKLMGVYTIVTDWNELEKSPAKQIADEYWNVSLLDYGELSKRVLNNKIDGIITGFTDSYLIPYYELCEMTGRPCYATKEQFAWTTNKSSFKEKCRKYNVPVVPEYDIRNFDKTIINKNHKVIIKPVDNSGSRGICICDNPEEFDEKLQYSLDYSEKKQVVVERYMDCDDVSFEYKIQDGEVMLTAICDRYIYKTLNEGSITSELLYPSKYADAYMADIDMKVKRMFETEGLKNGVLFMQAFADKGQFYFYEMGYRLSGGRHYIFTKNQNNESAVEELISFAITGKMSDQRLAELANPHFKNICTQISIICRTDSIASIKGWNEIVSLPQVINAMPMLRVGQSVGKQGTTASMFARLHVVVNTIEELKDVKQYIYSTLKVENKKGDNIVIGR